MNDTLCFAREPRFWENWMRRFHQWRHRNDPCNTELHARREFKALGYIPLDQPQEDGPNKWIQENVLELIRVFSKQGHSGFSAPYCIELFSKLANHEPTCPLTGADDEWNEVTDWGDGRVVYQNNRCSHVFKDETGAYDINGRIFREPDGCCYSSRDSRVYITFPYTPKSEYVDVGAEESAE